MKNALTALGLLAALAIGCLYGFAATEKHWFPFRLVRAAYLKVKPAAAPRRAVMAAADAGKAAQREAIGALTQLPYLQGYNPASGKSGVRVYDETRASPGWNLAVSAHGASAQLLDMRGAAHHRWSIDAKRVWPGLKLDPGRRAYGEYWRSAELLPEGDLLVVWEFIGMARIDRRSQLKWATDNGAHHDLAVAADGTIYALTREVHVVPSVNKDDPVYEDFVSILEPDGRTRRRISLLKAFEGSDYAAVLAGMPESGDILHANSLSILDGGLASRSPAFRAGNLLVSLRSLNAVAILDPQSEKIVWALLGQWRAQHSPSLLANGRLLVFDNFGGLKLGTSRVIELDPFTQEIAWRYGEKPGQAMFSETNGGAQRLENGDTLILESNAGRALEITPEGETVWEYVNPFRVGEKQELQATLTELMRLPASLPIDWADHPASPGAPANAAP